MAPLIPTPAPAPVALPATPSTGPNTGHAFTDTSNSNSASQHSPKHAALISGLTIGVAVFLGLLAALCRVERHRIAVWRSYSRRRQRGGVLRNASHKLNSLDCTPDSQGSEWEVRRDVRPVVPLPTALPVTVSQGWTAYDVQRSSAPMKAATAQDAPHHGLGVGMHSRAANESGATTYSHNDVSSPLPTHPGPAAPRELEATPHMHPPQAYLNRSLPASPSISSMPMPITPTTETTAPQTSPVAQTPAYQQQQQQVPVYTPSVYQPYPPTSLPQPQAHNHPHLQNGSSPSSAIPYASHSTLAALPYIPTANSNNTTTNTTFPQAPPAPPPSLPQPYSTISLGSTASLYRHINSNIDLYRGLDTQHSPHKTATTNSTSTSAADPPDIYRGLSSSPAKKSPRKNGDGVTGGDERPPWDHLSAEEALGGGWRNSTGGISGWETVREGEEDGGDEGREKHGEAVRKAGK